MTGLAGVATPGSAAGATSRTPLYAVLALWFALLVVGAAWRGELDAAWPRWSVAFWASAVWGINSLVLFYLVGPPFALSRIPVLSALFGLAMTVMGSGSYWATTKVFPAYRVFVERAALFVALCTLASLVGCVGVRLWGKARPLPPKAEFVWHWSSLRLLTYALLVACLLGTYVTIGRIGYVPILAGDPEFLRFEFHAIGGIWYRLSAQVGIVLGLLAGAQICARRATRLVWVAGMVGVVCASLYGNRFFAALPVGAILLLWDQVRQRVRLRALAIGFVIGVPALALLGFWRYQEAPIDVLGPATLVVYGTLMEFRDLAWSMDYYSGGHPLLHGSTLGGLVVPLLPSLIWSAVGVDKAAVYAYSNAAVVAQEMGQIAPQRVGLYGELFMNFGWSGALAGALIYGALLGFLDRQFLALRAGDAVRGIVLAVVAAATIYAQMGQWDMVTTAITSSCYPILLLAFLSTRRRAPDMLSR